MTAEPFLILAAACLGFTLGWKVHLHVEPPAGYNSDLERCTLTTQQLYKANYQAIQLIAARAPRITEKQGIEILQNVMDHLQRRHIELSGKLNS